MTEYTYVLHADQRTSGYNGKWLNLDISVTVVAGDYEEAKKEALRILHLPRTDTTGWRFFLKSVTRYEPPFPPPAEPPVVEWAERPSPRFRKRGIR